MSAASTSTEVGAVRPPTPPHHPTHGIRFAEEQIKTVIFDALQEDVNTIEQLPSGKSFNNRIYFISLKPKPSDDEELASNSVVLKIPGWNFGVDKIQNEVICLLLLEKHCPAIPTPRVLAWSEPGHGIQTVHRVDGNVSITEEKAMKPNEHEIMWILMTRLPGQTLQPEHLAPPSLDAVMQRLASYMSQWRSILPPTARIGNLRIVSENEANADGTYGDLFGLRVSVDGLLIGAATSALHNSQEYYKNKIRGELEILKANPNYIANRSTIVPMVEYLLSDVLPTTALFRRGSGQHTDSIFTHYDLSPRNILVKLDSNGQLGISGIVDFEFAGFFPPEDEFTNTVVAHEGDWPDHAWSSFSSHLQFSGVDIPEGKLWKQACAVIRIIENTAPWQLRVGGIQGEELNAALEHARTVVRENFAILTQG